MGAVHQLDSFGRVEDEVHAAACGAHDRAGRVEGFGHERGDDLLTGRAAHILLLREVQIDGHLLRAEHDGGRVSPHRLVHLEGIRLGFSLGLSGLPAHCRALGFTVIITALARDDLAAYAGRIELLSGGFELGGEAERLRP